MENGDLRFGLKKCMHQSLLRCKPASDQCVYGLTNTQMLTLSVVSSRAKKHPVFDVEIFVAGKFAYTEGGLEFLLTSKSTYAFLF